MRREYRTPSPLIPHRWITSWWKRLAAEPLERRRQRVAFNVQITAQDADNNTVTLFTGAGNTVDITSTGTLSAGAGTTATFTNGVLASHSVGGLGTATETGVSNAFTVDPGPLDHFLVEAVGGGAIGTQTAGTSFDIQITAQDANNNTQTFFDSAGNTVDISSTGTLSAGGGATATFTSGFLASHSVTITNTGSFTITATDSAGGLGTGTETGVTNSFTVDPGALDHFLVEAQGGGAIGTQIAGTGIQHPDHGPGCQQQHPDLLRRSRQHGRHQLHGYTVRGQRYHCYVHQRRVGLP